MKFLDTLEEVLLERGFPLDIVQKALETAQTIDAVEVVRCRDCKYYYDYGVNRDYCCHRSKCRKQVFDFKFKADDFCSYGERKEGADNGK